MLTHRGLRPIRHFWHMQIDLDGPVDPGPAPDGIEIAGMEPRDDLRVIRRDILLFIRIVLEIVELPRAFSF